MKLLKILAEVFRNRQNTTAKRPPTLEEIAFENGYRAISKSENPYPPCSALHQAWDRGFKARTKYDIAIW